MSQSLAHRHIDTPRPSRIPVQAGPERGRTPARPKVAMLLRAIARSHWAAVRERFEPLWTWAATESRRRKAARGFQPSLQGALEGRVMLTHWHVIPRVLQNAHFLLKHPNARAAFLKNFPPQVQRGGIHYHVGQITRRRYVVATQTAHGGQAVEVTALDGSHYLIKLGYTSNTLATNISEGANGQLGNATATSAASLVSQQNANYPQPIGTIRAYAMPGGRVGLIVDGSTQNTELTINPLGQRQYKGTAHSFAYGEAARNHVLNIGQLTVNSGQIGSILGYQDAVLSGPLRVPGNTSIDRIAFDAILPGASIKTGGDVQTLDVLTGIDLSGARSGISIGRDLNLLNVGTNITLSNGADFTIGRNLGLVSQPPKGTATGSNVLTLNYTTVSNSIISVTIPAVGAYIQGNVNIGPNSVFGIGGQIYNTMYVEGSVNGYARLFEHYGTPGQTNPPYLTQLPQNSSGSSVPPTSSGPAPNGYVVALQGITP